MAQDSPNDKRHVLVALLRPSPVSLAVCMATPDEIAFLKAHEFTI